MRLFFRVYGEILGFIFFVETMVSSAFGDTSSFGTPFQSRDAHKNRKAPHDA